MRNFIRPSIKRLSVFHLGFLLALGMMWPSSVTAQNSDEHLAKQLMELQAKMNRIESALNQKMQPSPGNATAASGQSDMQGMQNTPSDQVQASTDSPQSRIKVAFQNCTQCHQTRPSGPLPASHLDFISGSGSGVGSTTNTADTQRGSNSGMAMNDQGGGGSGMAMNNQGGGGGGMGMGMMGKGMGMMGKGKGMMGGGMGGMSGMGGGSGDGMGSGQGGMSGMGGGSGGGMGSGSGGMSSGAGGMSGMGDQGIGSMGGSDTATGGMNATSMQQQMEQMQQQMQMMMQMQMMQMKVMEMQMKMMEMGR